MADWREICWAVIAALGAGGLLILTPWMLGWIYRRRPAHSVPSILMRVAACLVAAVFGLLAAAIGCGLFRVAVTITEENEWIAYTVMLLLGVSAAAVAGHRVLGTCLGESDRIVLNWLQVPALIVAASTMCLLIGSAMLEC